MPRARMLAALVSAVLLMPAVVLAPMRARAADEVPPGPQPVPGVVDVAGVAQLPDGSPVAGADVTLLVAGSDVVLLAETGTDGTFAFAVEAGAGDVLDLDAIAPAVAVGEPDEEGCQAYAATRGRMEVTLGEGAPDRVTLVLDESVGSEVCTASGAPARTPRVTPPATDASVPGAAPRPGGADGALVTLAAFALATLALARRWRRA